MKKLLVTLLITAFVLTGCGGSKKDAAAIAGDYYAFRCTDEDGQELELEDEVLHVYDDGTGVFEIAGQSFSFKWKLNGNKFTFKDEDGDEFDGTFVDTVIGGSYFNGYFYMFTSDREWYDSMMSDGTGSKGGGSAFVPAVETQESSAVYYTVKSVYEPTYGIKVANVLVPYGWSVSANVEWGMCSTMYPALATITLASPDKGAVIDIMSTMGYMQMSRNGSPVPEGTYLDFYNIFLNYRNAHEYNDYLLGLMGYKGTIMSAEGPAYEFQLALNGEANTYLSALSSGTGVTAKACEGTYEKTTYFISEGNAYEVMISSTVLMAEIINGAYDTCQWLVPYAAAFTAFDEKAYSDYFRVFDNVVANTSFANEFIYVVQRNAQYLNEMMHNYLMEKVYTPSSGDISSWDGEYVDNGNDRFINEWCDVITERDEYTTADGNSIKVSTAYDTVYQDGDTIYMGPDAYAPEGWTQLNKK